MSERAQPILNSPRRSRRRVSAPASPAPSGLHFRARMLEQVLDVHVVTDPRHLAVPPPELDGRAREPLGTDLLPMHDDGLAVHPRQRELPLPGESAVVAEVRRTDPEHGELRDTHELD